ncbi:hypothetical protein FQA39_LY13545 [Lamprigera yunnana]|nr:hypothetical protein FQA39_LY13545 [Lamprigera yunnana]
MRDSTRFQDVNEEGQDVENFNSQSDGDEEDVKLSDVSNEDKEDKNYESKYVDDMDRRSKLAAVVHEAIAIPAKKLKLNISDADSEILRKSFNDHISKAGTLVLKDEIKIFTINYNIFGKHHQGTKEFTFWYLPQIQYKNPQVQIATFKNLTPSPFIRCFYESGQQMLIDCDNKSKEEIHQHLLKVVGKTKDVLQKEATAKVKKDNPANFGVGCDRHCICEISGQLTCPQIVPLPKHMRGKFRNVE